MGVDFYVLGRPVVENDFQLMNFIPPISCYIIYIARFRVVSEGVKIDFKASINDA